jgi:hypothetical protein
MAWRWSIVVALALFFVGYIYARFLTLVFTLSMLPYAFQNGWLFIHTRMRHSVRVTHDVANARGDLDNIVIEADFEEDKPKGKRA